MNLHIKEPLLSAILADAERQGRTPEAVATEALWMHFPVKLVPRNERERRLFSIGIDCGVSLTNEQLSREAMYD